MTHSFYFRTSLLGLALALSSSAHAWTTWNFTLPSSGSGLSAPCSNGVPTLGGSGDRGGTMNISSAKGAYYRTNASHGFFIVPQVPIPSAAILAGTYSVFNYNYAASQTINATRVTISGTSGSGNTLSNVATGTTTSEAWTMSGITINSPVPGMLAASFTKTGGATTKMACAVYLRTYRGKPRIGVNEAGNAQAAIG